MTNVSSSKRRRVFARDDYKCVYCERTCILEAIIPDSIFKPVIKGPLATVDHLVPVSLGGSNEESNLVTACKRCNGERGTMPVAEYLAMRRALGPKASLTRSFRGKKILSTTDV